MDQIRSFIAIELPESIRLNLAQIENKLKTTCQLPVRWVPSDNIHLTLKFLGNIDPSKIDVITEAVKSGIHEQSPFILNFTRLGVFPDLKNIQVVWIGLGGELDALHEVQNKIEMDLVSLGFPTENRLFTAHLTLARITKNISYLDKQFLARVISNTEINCDISFKVTAINLMRSQLTRYGVIYSCLSQVEMKYSC